MKFRIVLRRCGINNCWPINDYEKYWQALIWIILHGYIFLGRHCLYWNERVQIVKVYRY